MNRKDKPYVYIDTHAGAGMYSLRSAQADKTSEYVDGIGKLLEPANTIDSPSLCAYLSVVAACSSQGDYLYPGSPEIARQILRPQDKGFAYELHSADVEILTAHFARDRRFKVFQSDGFKGLLSHMPPPTRRAVVLMDPPYEVKDDYQTVINSLKSAYQRFATGTFIIWYPVVDRKRITVMERALQESNIPSVQLFELGLGPDTAERGMTSSGMIVVNPPFTLKPAMESLLPELAKRLSKSGQWRVMQLCSESH